MFIVNSTVRGVFLNIVASIFFAAMFGYTTLLSQLDGGEIFGWRILFTFPCLALFIYFRGYGYQIKTIYRRFSEERGLVVTRFLSASILSFQLWLFVWAPGNEYGLAVSLGYFILPLTMVLIGHVAFKDKMTALQKLACIFALSGIVYQIVFSQNLAWPTLAVCLGYPGYFWLRRKTDTNDLGGLWFDMLLGLPLAIYFIIRGGEVVFQLDSSFVLLWLVIGLGILSALALTFQSLSAPHLNLTLFGLLVYVEPVLLLLVSLLIGETIAPKEWPTYIAILLSVLALLVEGVRGLKWRNASV